MSYKIINNISTKDNHFIRLKELFKVSDCVIISSPFLMTNFMSFLSEEDCTSLKELHIISTLVPESSDQINKIKSLISFIELPFIKNKRVYGQISFNNKLHGKVYIFKKGNKYVAAIISSANFTNNGLCRNHEWGVEISDKLEIQKLEKSILGTIEIENVDFDLIYQMEKVTTDFKIKNPKKEIDSIGLRLVELIPTSIWVSQLDKSVKYWLKPIGVTDNPIPEGRLFNESIERLNFSKRKPSGVNLNDVLIAYGVGTTKILSIYKVISFPEKATQEEIQRDKWLERWPWYVDAKNLTPNYGSTWFKYNFRINSLKSEFLKTNPQNTITAAGSQSLGALNFGSDKLELSLSFAKFIIDKVVEINDK